MDHDGFAGVPLTTYVEVSHPSLPNQPVYESEVTSAEYLNLISGLLPLKGSTAGTEPSN